jgi:integrase
VTFVEVCDEFLRWIEFDRQRKRSTLDDYRSAVRAHLIPAFGSLQVEDVTPARVDAWRSEHVIAGRLSNPTVNKLLTILHGILERARKRFKLPSNPVAEVEKQPRKRRVSIDVYSTEEVLALVRKADTAQDGAIFLTAAFTGLRMGELLALRWRDVDRSHPSRPPRSALPRPAPHLRHPRDPHRRPARVAGMDGPRRFRDDRDLPLVQAAGGGGPTTRCGLRGNSRGARRRRT